jgi:hypothetical protein
MGLANLGSESETCVVSRVHLVGVFISFEKDFYRLAFTPPLSGSPYRSFRFEIPDRHAFVTPRLRELKIPDLCEFFAPENLLHKFH